MPRKVKQTKNGPMVQWTVYIPEPIVAAFEKKARKDLRTPAEAVRQAFRDYAEKK